MAGKVRNVVLVGHSGAGKDGREDTIAGGLVSSAARALHGVRRIEYRAVARVAHPVERAHVGDEVVIAKRDTAFGEEKSIISC